MMDTGLGTNDLGLGLNSMFQPGNAGAGGETDYLNGSNDLSLDFNNTFQQSNTGTEDETDYLTKDTGSGTNSLSLNANTEAGAGADAGAGAGDNYTSIVPTGLGSQLSRTVEANGRSQGQNFWGTDEGKLFGRDISPSSEYKPKPGVNSPASNAGVNTGAKTGTFKADHSYGSSPRQKMLGNSLSTNG